MALNQQKRLLNDLAQDLVVLDGRVHLAQQMFSGCAPEADHLAEMQNCVRQMIQSMQLIHQSESACDGQVASLP
ncbi:hypothetical protein C2W62_43920 [Candidatus Entotheonella serta]|nr:hypothetical protein C2W62_43920 [Candidatus Entotheonella serta]